MKNNKGQSLIDVIFSVGIIVLVLTGVVTLVVSTAKVKRMAFERQKAVELSQLLIENKILEIKNSSSFWGSAINNVSSSQDASTFGSDFSGYTYIIEQKDCTDHEKCNILFTVRWEGVGQSLSVNRLFLKKGI